MLTVKWIPNRKRPLTPFRLFESKVYSVTQSCMSRLSYEISMSYRAVFYWRNMSWAEICNLAQHSDWSAGKKRVNKNAGKLLNAFFTPIENSLYRGSTVPICISFWLFLMFPRHYADVISVCRIALRWTLLTQKPSLVSKCKKIIINHDKPYVKSDSHIDFSI